MKIFWVFVKKEFWHVLRDRFSLMILLGLPVLMMLIFGFALSNEVKDVQVGVWDQSKDQLSRQLIQQIEQSAYFELAENVTQYEAIESGFQTGELDVALVIPADFQVSLEGEGKVAVQLLLDDTNPNAANTRKQYLQAIIGSFQQGLQASGQPIPYQIKLETRMLYNPQLKSVFQFVPGVMTLVLMLLGAMMTSVSIVREKEMGTMEVLLVSPMKPILVVLSKALPYLVLCFVDVLIILLLCYTVLEMPIRGNQFLLLAECLLFILTTLSLGLLISTVVDSQQTAMFISLVGLMMPSVVFSGFMFPIDNMPTILQGISVAVPTQWFYNIVKNIMVKGLGFSYIWKDTLILLGMTLFFLTVALRNFKVRLA